MNHKTIRLSLILGSLFLFLAVLFGAFGAHALEKMFDATKLKTFETGIRYQFYHSFGLIIVGILGHLYKINITKIMILFSLGILLFSFNCYLYILFANKVFAMIVPVGGTCFLIGWLNLFVRLFQIKEA